MSPAPSARRFGIPRRLPGVALLLVRRVGGVRRGTAVARPARPGRAARLALLGVLVAHVRLAGIFGGDGVVALIGHGDGLPARAPRKPRSAQSGSSGTGRP